MQNEVSSTSRKTCAERSKSYILAGRPVQNGVSSIIILAGRSVVGRTKVVRVMTSSALSPCPHTISPVSHFDAAMRQVGRRMECLTE